MPGATWDDKSERDLLLAIVITHLCEQSGSDLKAKINWGPVTEQMVTFGYVNTTSGAISQRLTKKLLKEYKDALKDSDGKLSTPGGAARKTAKTPTSKRKAKAAPAEEDDEAPETPSKKPKLSALESGMA